MSSGKIVQIIGAVIDVEFPSDAIPKIYDALNVEGEGIDFYIDGARFLPENVSYSRVLMRAFTVD